VDPIANSKTHKDHTYGVLKLTLHPKGYDWRFVPVKGRTSTDSGSARCH
jgi:acid phosphatase type 7